MNKYSRKELEEVVLHLQQGHVILYPTDTVWGLGCDAHNADAVKKIAAIKKMPTQQPFVVLVSSLKMLCHYVPQLPPKAGDLIEYYDRPLTILYDKVQHLPAELAASDGTIAIRLCKDAFCKSLIQTFGAAIVASIAAPEGKTIPKSFKEVASEIKTGVDYVVSYAQDQVSEFLPSTMVRLDENNELVFLRKG